MCATDGAGQHADGGGVHLRVRADRTVISTLGRTERNGAQDSYGGGSGHRSVGVVLVVGQVRSLAREGG